MKTKFLSIDEIQSQALFPEMWDIYRNLFDLSEEDFLKSQRNFDYYAIFFSKSGRMVGFCGIRDGQMRLDQQLYRTVYMGHFSVKPDFRGKSLIPLTLVRLFLDHHLKMRKGKLIVWGDAGTYRSYLVMAKGTKYFYPSPDPTPNAWTPKLAAMGKALGHQSVSGTYDPERGIVHSRIQIARQKAYQITEKDLLDPHIRYYVERNPGYANGDGLVFLCPANFANLWYYMIQKGMLKKMLRKTWRKMTGQKRRPIVNPVRVEG